MGWSRICIGAVPYHPSDVCAWTMIIPCHICTATGLSPYHIRTIRNAKARACQPPPHLPRDRAHPAAPWHICPGAGKARPCHSCIENKRPLSPGTVLAPWHIRIGTGPAPASPRHICPGTGPNPPASVAVLALVRLRMGPFVPGLAADRGGRGCMPLRLCRPCAGRSVARMGTRSTHTGGCCGCMPVMLVSPAPRARWRSGLYWFALIGTRSTHTGTLPSADEACRPCAVRIAYCRCAAQAALVRHSPPRLCRTAPSAAQRAPAGGCGVDEPRPRVHRHTRIAARHAPICVTPMRPHPRPRERLRLILQRWLAMSCSGSRWSSP